MSSSHSPFTRRAAALALAGAWSLVCLALARHPATAQTAPAGPILVGVSGPLTGQFAQYGAQWKKGFDLALDEINAAGGIGGRRLEYVFEDSQSDPRQSIAIARKFVADPRVVAELGDFSSAASMAASPIYQAGGLLQFGFTNSHPDFTKGGDFMWSNAPNQTEEIPSIADFAFKELGLKKIATLYINNDWGRTNKDLLVTAAAARDGQIVGAEGYLAEEKDFRSAIVRVRETNPDGILLISYYPDAAQIVRQIRLLGLTLPIVSQSPIYSPKFIELAGEAANGVLTNVPFFPGDPRPEVQRFVGAYKAKYGEEPDAYNGRAYDAVILLAAAIRKGGADRRAVRDNLALVRDVPSVVYGVVEFDTPTRRVVKPLVHRVIIRDLKFIAYEGKKG